MTTGKETMRAHLCRLLELTESDYKGRENEYFKPLIKKYKTFLSSLKLENASQECQDAADLIFKDLYKRGMSLKAYTAKSRGQEQLREQLKYYYDEQKDYFRQTLKPRYIEFVYQNNHSCKDAQIEFQEMRYKQSVGLGDTPKNDAVVDPFWQRYQRMQDVMNEYLDKILHLLFSSYYDGETSSPIAGAPGIRDAIRVEKEYYQAVKRNKKDYKDDETTDNPYKNMYVYCRNAYARAFCDLEMPSLQGFLDFRNYKMPFQKDMYTLHDVARIYKSMTESEDSEEKIYERIKKEFQNSKLMKRFKQDSSYRISPNEITIPLSEYAYFRRKLNQRSEDASPFGPDERIITNRYAPLLNAMIRDDTEKLQAYAELREFLSDEVNDLFLPLSHRYQDTMMSFLKESLVRIYGLCVNCGMEAVYRDWKEVVKDGENSQ